MSLVIVVRFADIALAAGYHLLHATTAEPLEVGAARMPWIALSEYMEFRSRGQETYITLICGHVGFKGIATVAGFILPYEADRMTI